MSSKCEFVPIEGKKILLISPEAWGRSFVSKHHYASYLAENNDVVFLGPPKKFQPKLALDPTVERDGNTGVMVAHTSNLIPRLNSLPAWAQKSLYQVQAKQIHRATQIHQFDLIWSFNPFHYWDLGCWNARRRIYHSVDVHPHARFEAQVCRSADMVVALADLILGDLRRWKSRIVKVGHGCDISSFSKVESIKLPGKNSVKLGLVGNFNKNMDFQLLSSIATQNPEADLILVGPTSQTNLGDKALPPDIEKLQLMDNVFFVGEVPSHRLIDYLCQFDINLVLYREDRRYINFCPHKLMGYFYSGKMTVASWILEYEGRDEDLLKMTKDNTQIPGIISELLKNLDQHNSEALQAKRRQFAEDNSYPRQIERVVKHLDL